MWSQCAEAKKSARPKTGGLLATARGQLLADGPAPSLAGVDGILTGVRGRPCQDAHTVVVAFRGPIRDDDNILLSGCNRIARQQVRVVRVPIARDGRRSIELTEGGRRVVGHDHAFGSLCKRDRPRDYA